MKRPTLKDVAATAGVSPITVSRALRNPDSVSPELRKKIDAAVAELGYLPNTSASTLASQNSNLIVALVPSISNHVFTDVLTGISDALEGTHCVLQIGTTKYDPSIEEKILRNILNPSPKGIILTGLEQTDKTKFLLKRENVPLVQIMDIEGEAIGSVIGFSHDLACQHATEHLIASQYRHLGFLASQKDARAKKRALGFQKAVARAGEDVCGNLTISDTPSNTRIGRELLSKHLAKFPDCDAVMCVNEDIALGALFECQRRGLRVPEDFGICGFNDLGVSSECVPSITTVTTPLYDIGKKAANLLLSPKPQDQNVVEDVGFFLSIRSSTARMNKA